MSSFDLRGDGQVLLITGGASGIGRAFADVFGAAGYRVLIADKDSERGEAAIGELEESGVEAAFVACDVRNQEQIAAAVEAAVSRWERLDVLCNNAGISGRGVWIESLDEEELERVLSVDLKAAFLTCKHAVPVMRTQGSGVILNIASITADTGSAYYSAYGAAKAGIMSLTRGLARHLGRFNIRINCLNPGSIAGTDLMSEFYEAHPEARQKDKISLARRIPMGRAGRPTDVAHFALFLASPLAAHIHGAVLTIDGGETLGYQ